mgnify:CR=1 FL=1
MIYQIVSKINSDEDQVYARIDDDDVCRLTCNQGNKEFQAWLLANKDSLPSDIQAKIDAGELTIADAD